MKNITDRFSLAEKIGILAILSASLCFLLIPSRAPLPLYFFLLLCLIAPFFQKIGFFLPVLSRAEAGETGVVLTFDDGPSPSFTPVLLELLAHHNLPATFFVVGEKATEHPDLIKQILDSGHSVGNHSWEHDYFLMLRSEKRLREDIHQTQEVLAQAGIRPRVFRPPVGITGPRLRKALMREGLCAVTYSCRAFDRGNRDITDLAEKIIRRLRPGDIMMLHDLPAYRKEQAEYLCREFDRLFGILAEKYTVIPLERAIRHPVMQTEKESLPPGTGC